MSQYIDPKTAAASYRPIAGTMSPGLKRAREPYRFRNALTGLVLGVFGVAVWAYSISAVKQDVFDDIDEEARALQNQGPAGNASRPLGQSASRDQLSVGSPSQIGTLAVDSTSPSRSRVDEAILAGAATGEVISNVPLKAATASPLTPPKRGILQSLDSRFPKLLDPVSKTLVWGAPPVDNMGTISSSGSKLRR